MDAVGKLPVNCTHHWVIEPANGETSQAVCRICGARREFANGFIRKKGGYNWPASMNAPDEFRKDYYNG